MTKIKALGILATAVPAALLLAGCQTVGEVSDNHIGSATLQFADGRPAGTAQFVSVGDGVNVVIALTGFQPGARGTHLHMVGTCTAPDFASAGGHLNPGGHQHGTDNPQGSHMGDLPNIQIGANGTGTATTRIKGTKADVMKAIFDTDGTAVVVHANADDYKTDPAGNAGGRIACGVVKAS